MITTRIYIDASGSYGGPFFTGLLAQRGGKEVGSDRAINTKAIDSWAAEAYGLLKAIEWAAKEGLRLVHVVTDCGAPFGGGKGKSPSSKQARKYVWVANKIAKENGIRFQVSRIDREQNLADSVARGK